MVIKREENINQSKKWNIYIKSKSILKKKLAKSNIEIKIAEPVYAHHKLVKTLEDIDKWYEKNKYKTIIIEDPQIDEHFLLNNKIKSYTGGESIKARPRMTVINNELLYEDNVNIWRRIKIVPYEKK